MLECDYMLFSYLEWHNSIVHSMSSDDNNIHVTIVSIKLYLIYSTIRWIYEVLISIQSHETNLWSVTLQSGY